MLFIDKPVSLNMLKGLIVTVTRIETESDHVKNCSKCFLQYIFLIWNFMDAIKEGDMFRTNVCLKTFILLFYCHSELSKYLPECIDYIQKTEILLSPKMSMKVRASSFINKSGRIGKTNQQRSKKKIR